jgi:hypothetical protein
MMKLDLLSAALLSAALLTTPAMARKSQVTSELFTANAFNSSGQACCRNHARDLPNLADHDGWGHLRPKKSPEAREKSA